MKSKAIYLTFLIFLSSSMINANEKLITDLNDQNSDCKNITRDTVQERSFSNDFVGTFNGKKIEYTASLKEKIIYEKDDPNLPMASFFYTEYI